MQISKLQLEIDREAEHRAELARRTRAMTDKKLKATFDAKLEKSDEKLDSMTVLMLHYCAGLQHCLDQEELERQKQSVHTNGKSVECDSVTVVETELASAFHDEMSINLTSAGTEVENSLSTEQENSEYENNDKATGHQSHGSESEQKINADRESNYKEIVTNCSDSVAESLDIQRANSRFINSCTIGST